MDRHNRAYPSLRWVHMDDEQILCRHARPAGKVRSEVRSSGFEVPKTSNVAPRTILFSASLSLSDLTPRRGLVYDAVRFQLLLCTQRRRNATWQEMH